MARTLYQALYRHVGAKKSDPWIEVVTHEQPNGKWTTRLGAQAALDRAMKRDGTIRGHVHAIKVKQREYLRTKALAIAGHWVGIREQGGNNRGPDVERIVRKVHGVIGAPWCGYFVGAAYLEAGCTVVTASWGAVRFLGILTGQRILRNVRSALAGDILVFDFQHDGTPDHTGLLRYWARELPNGEKVRCAAKDATHAATREGNTSMVDRSDSSTGGDGAEDKFRPIDQIQHAVRVYRTK